MISAIDMIFRSNFFQQVRHTCHRAVLVHDLDQCPAGLQSGHARQVDDRFGMSRAAQHSPVTGPERENMSRTPQVRRLGLRIDQCADRCGAVVRADSGRTSFAEQVDRNGERRAQQRRIVGHLHVQFQLLATVFGQWCAHHPASVVQHEVDDFGRDLFRSDDEVAFVFTVFVVDDDYDFPLADILEYLFDTIEHTLFCHGFSVLWRICD